MFNLIVNEDMSKVEVVSPDGTSQIHFSVSKIAQINRKVKNGYNDNEIYRAFYLLNGYLDHKGVEFKQELYKKMLEASEYLESMPNVGDIEPMPLHITYNVLGLFNLEDIENYIMYVDSSVTPPTNLNVDFDPNMEKNKLGSREQTYLKEDYQRLAALSIPIKAVFGIIGHYAFLRKDVLSHFSNEKYVLLKFINTPHIEYSEPMEKLREMVEKIIVQTHNTVDDFAPIILSNTMISEDEIPKFYLSSVLLEQLVVTSFIDDTEEANVVTRIYNIVNSKIDYNKKQNTLKVQDKRYGDKDGMASDEREMSQFEHYQHTTDMSQGDRSELNYAVSSLQVIYSQVHGILGTYVKYEDMIEGYEAAKIFLEEGYLVRKFQTLLLSFVAKYILDPRAIPYLEIKNLVNLMAFAYAYCKSIGFYDIGVIITSVYEENPHQLGVSTFSIGGGYIGKNKINQELRDTLDHYFNCLKHSNQVKGSFSNVTEDIINKVLEDIKLYKMVSHLPKETLQEYYENTTNLKNIIIAKDARKMLASFIIENEAIYEQWYEEDALAHLQEESK